MLIAKYQIALLALVAVSTLASAQTPAAPGYVPTLTFDIVSIRESAGVTPGGGLKVGVKSPPHSSILEVGNFTTRSLIQLAYGFGTPVSGGPDWLSETFYNIQAKSDPSVDAQMAKLTDDQSHDEKLHMVQVLLADRYHLKFHMETRDTSVFALVPAKGGTKLHAVPVDPDKPAPASMGNDVQTHGGAQGLEFVTKSFSPTAITALLTTQVETPVIDRTGLTGYYSFTLQMGREWSSHNPDSWPDIFTAVQEQLGLKLERTRAPIPVLVIDHIDKPTAN